MPKTPLISISRHATSKLSAGGITGGLLRWYGQAARDLPWRKPGVTPYGILVSEIMLQQTQVDTVIPFWNRWMARFPTVEALAGANEGEALRYWAGLGYYSRLRNLLKAAAEIVAEHGGRIPDDEQMLLGLSGIGPYTAGAILSIAFNRPVPAIDGNVERVLSRYFGLTDEKGRTPAWKTRVRQAAQTAVDQAVEPERPGERNAAALSQAFMDLGATLCTPVNPACPRCPIRRGCFARGSQRIAQYPPPKPRVTPVLLPTTIWMVEHRERWLGRKRPAGINRDLWEFPIASEPTITCVHPLASPEAGAVLEVCLRGGGETGILGGFPHAVTRFRLQIEVRTLRLGSIPRELTKLAKSGGWEWKTSSELAELAMSAAHHRALGLASGGGPQAR